MISRLGPMSPKTQGKKMKPILYPQAFLEDKIARKWNVSYTKFKYVCLMKYFPKYYKSLVLHREYGQSYDSLKKSIQFKIRQLKIVKAFSCDNIPMNEKRVKMLLRGCRKTLASVPSSDREQNLSLCLYFARLKTINVQRHWPYSFEEENKHLNRQFGFKNEDIPLPYWKFIKRINGYFWDGNRLVENLKVSCESAVHLILITKLNNSKRFLSSLKTLELSFCWESQTESANKFVQLMKNKSFLQHVTHLKFKSYRPEFCFVRELVQSLASYCPRVFSISLPTLVGDYEGSDIDLSVNLNSFQKLQFLKIKKCGLETLMKKVEFPSCLREAKFFLPKGIFDFSYLMGCEKATDDVPQYGEILEYVDEETGAIENFFQCQGVDSEVNVRVEEEDAKDWESFERYKFMESLLEKWRKLNNLKVLILRLENFSKMQMKTSILPLLRELPRLETLKWQLCCDHECLPRESIFDLDTFFEGIKSLTSLKTLVLASSYFIECDTDYYYTTFAAQKSFFLPSLCELDISFGSFQKFDTARFFKSIFHILKSQPRNEITRVELSRIDLRSERELAELIKLLSQASQFETLRIEIEVGLFVRDVDDFNLDFRYSMHLSSNIKIKLFLYSPYKQDCPRLWKEHQVFPFAKSPESYVNKRIRVFPDCT